MMPDFSGAEKFIVKRLRNELPETLIYHSISHTFDVSDAAARIGRAEGIPQEDLDILRLAALFHDSGYIYGRKNHELKGCEVAKEILPSFGFSHDQLNCVCGMIRATRVPQQPRTLLEEILCDADLDYLGRADYAQHAENLLEELRNLGEVLTNAEWVRMQKKFLEAHRYHTSFSRENREPSKQKNLKSLSEIASLSK